MRESREERERWEDDNGMVARGDVQRKLERDKGRVPGEDLLERVTRQFTMNLVVLPMA